MPTNIVLRPPTEIIDPPSPPPPDVLASLWLARRFRLPPAIAGVVRELASLGGAR